MDKKKFNIKEFENRVDFNDYEPLEPIEAIQAFCKECYCWDVKEMKECTCTMCPFNQFLVNDFKVKKKRKSYNISEEERNKRRERMLKMFNNKNDE